MSNLIEKIISKQVNPIQSHCEELEQKMREYKSELEQTKLICESYQDQLIGHQKQLNDCNEQFIGHQEQLNDCNEQLIGHQEQLTRHQEQLNTHSEQFKAHQDQFTGHQAQLADHQTQLNRHQLLIDECVLQIRRTWQAISATQDKNCAVPVRYAMMPYHSIEVEGIIYFYHKKDQEIPDCMDRTGMNYSKYDIDNFLHVSDEQFYGGNAPSTGLFLDIGGNIGTTTIYCKKKRKPYLHYIAFEPVETNAKLFQANCVMNDCEDVIVEKIALSNCRRNNVAMEVSSINSGSSKLALLDEKHSDQLEYGINTVTLDEYMNEHEILPNEIKYIWLDVEGHETEVLKGAEKLFNSTNIPMCMEYNQEIYKNNGNYEEMLAFLKQHFKYFVVCSQYAQGKTLARSVSELRLLWEELGHESCDLILWA